MGIAKINVATELVTVYAKKIQELQNENPNIRYTDMIFSEAALAFRKSGGAKNQAVLPEFSNYYIFIKNSDDRWLTI